MDIMDGRRNIGRRKSDRDEMNETRGGVKTDGEERAIAKSETI